ncbi:MAG: hypothetical protein DCO81_07725 [Candidatus Aquiluna sp. XM-24bin5]|nr:MAG: hypothetical protein DCO81_07725 [Candidatus Aquiluna sp. XM-24bin5]
MNKYSSGYNLITFVSFLGALVAIGSIGFGVFVFVESPRGLEYTGIFIAVGGFIQGLFLLGFAEIGRAILDGSLAQQELLKAISKFPDQSSGEIRNTRNEDKKYPVLPSSGTVKSYKGYRIIKNDNNFSIEGIIEPNFDNVLAAEKWIDKLKSPA